MLDPNGMITSKMLRLVDYAVHKPILTFIFDTFRHSSGYFPHLKGQQFLQI